MKRKLGAPRRREDRASEKFELRCWKRVFVWGVDWLGDLEPLGLGLKRLDGFEDEKFVTAARDAWRRLGRHGVRTPLYTGDVSRGRRVNSGRRAA